MTEDSIASHPLQVRGREHSFDLMKGLAIYLVVMGHVLTMCIRGIDAAFIFKLIGQIHMPVFFFISGYFTYKSTNHRTFAVPRLGRRFCQLVIPFFVVSSLWVLYFPHSGLQSPLSDNLPDLYRSYWKDGYWFTLCLFELCLIYYGMSWLLSRIRSTWVQVILLLVVYVALTVLSFCFSSEEKNVDYLGLGLLARFFPIYMMGVMAHKSKAWYDRWRKREWVLFVSILLFAVLLYVIVYPWDMPWGENEVAVKIISFMAVPVMQLALIVLAMAVVEPWSNKEYNNNVKPSIVARYFNKLGNESLGIYLLHYFFLFPLTILQEPLKQMGLGFTPLAVVAVAVAFCIIALTLLVVNVVKRSKYLSLILIGNY